MCRRVFFTTSRAQRHFFLFAVSLEHFIPQIDHSISPELVYFLSIISLILILIFSIMVYSGATECLPCSSGGRLNETHCSCFAGSHRVNQTSCSVCGPGTYTPRDNMLECVECAGNITDDNKCLCPKHMDLIDDVCVRRNCTPGQKMVSFSLNY